MTYPTIASMIDAGPLALDADRGHALMQMEFRHDVAADDMAFVLERGERFALSRGVAVVPIKGLLTPNMFAFERYFGWSTYHGIEQTCAALAAADDVEAVALEVDSAGGMVIGIEAAADAIKALAAIKPVHVLVNPVAASAAYWLAACGTDIAMTGGAVVGSIGIMVEGSAPVETGMHGWRDVRMTSSHARAKNPDMSTESGAALTQARLDELEALFHSVVAEGRGIEVADLLARLTDTGDVADGGGHWRPDRAIEKGLADQMQSRDAFFAALFDKYAPKPKPVGSRAFAAQAAAQAAAARAKL